MYSEVAITRLESRNLAELFMNGFSCKFIQSLTMICCMDRIFIGLVYSLVPRLTPYKVMFTHLRQSQTSQYQTIFNISPHLHFRWYYLWSKTWCMVQWYNGHHRNSTFFLSITAYPKCKVLGVGGRPLCPAHNRALSRSSSEQAARGHKLWLRETH